MDKVAFIVSHPIQYFSPLFRLLSKKMDLTVIYLSDETLKTFMDKEFSAAIKWDIPLLKGYRYKLLKNNSPVHSVSRPPFGLLNLGILNEITNKKYDCIIVHGWHYVSHWLVYILCILRQLPFYIRSESPLNQEKTKPDWKIYIKKILLGYLFRRAAGLLAIGTQNRRFYGFYGVENKKIFYAPYSVDNDRLMPKKRKTKKDKIVILFVGKLIEKKRPMDLLQAFERISYETKALYFVGEGKMKRQLQKYTKKNHLKNVFFPGFVNQTALPDYYNMADIFVLPSGIGETWGLVVNEAMCFGLPVIVSDISGCSTDLVKQGKNGYIFKTGDIGQLSRYLNMLIKNKKLRNQMGSRSLKIIGQFSCKAAAEGIAKAVKRK